jgi:hypothetical protein
MLSTCLNSCSSGCSDAGYSRTSRVNPLNTNGDKSMEILVTILGIPTANETFSANNTFAASDMSIFLFPSRSTPLKFYIYMSERQITSLPQIKLSFGVPIHIVVCRTSSNFNIFVNGTVLHATETPTTVAYDANTRIVGYRYSTTHDITMGKLHYVRFYARDVSEDIIPMFLNRFSLAHKPYYCTSSVNLEPVSGCLTDDCNLGSRYINSGPLNVHRRLFDVDEW